MEPQDIQEMRIYLDTLESTPGYKLLLRVEVEKLNEAKGRPDDLDWAELGGSEVLRDYFFLADDTARRNQLAQIAHLRSKAWFAVWSFFGISDGNLPTLKEIGW